VPDPCPSRDDYFRGCEEGGARAAAEQGSSSGMFKQWPPFITRAFLKVLQQEGVNTTAENRATGCQTLVKNEALALDDTCIASTYFMLPILCTANLSCAEWPNK
jgi:hypothetical protein